jgi:hypothetical protein
VCEIFYAHVLNELYKPVMLLVVMTSISGIHCRMFHFRNCIILSRHNNVASVCHSSEVCFSDFFQVLFVQFFNQSPSSICILNFFYVCSVALSVHQANGFDLSDIIRVLVSTNKSH